MPDQEVALYSELTLEQVFEIKENPGSYNG